MSEAARRFLPDGSAVAALIRARDWRGTPLGRPEGWPQPLRTLLAVMLGSAQPMFLVWGRERTLLYNDAYAAVLAAKHPDALGRPFLDVWHEIRDDLRPIVEAAYRGEAVQMDDITLMMERRGFREETHFAFSYTPVQDEEGRVGGFFCALRETTGQVAAERRLRDGEARLRSVIDGMSEGFALLDRDFRILDMNDEGLRMEGRPRSAVVGRTQWEAHPATRDSEIGRLYRKAMAERVPVSLDHRYDFPDGTARWLEMRAYPVPEGLAVFYRDVTERKEAEERLRASEARAREEGERVQLALDAGAILGTWDWDVAADRFTADDRFARTFGLDPQECRRGLTLGEVVATVHPQDRSALSERIAQALARGGLYRHQYRVRGQGGAYRWIEANGRVDLGPDGRARRFPGVLLDIAARRAAEEERDRVRRLLETFAEAVPGVVYAKDREGRMLVANRGATALIGKPPEAYLGRTDLEFLDDEAQARALMETDRRIMESGAAEQVEEAISLPDGSPAIWYSTKAPLRDGDGAVVGLIGASIDITARKRAESALRESEERFRFALDAAGGIGTWDWDVARDVVHTSEHFARLYGLDPDRARAGVPVEDYLAGVYPEDRDRVRARIAEVVAAGGDYRAEYRIRRQDGEVRWVIARGRCLLDDEGRPVRFPGVTFDITDRKAAEAAVAESEERFRNMADHAPVMMWVTDPSGSCLYLNRLWHEFTGQTPEEVQGLGWLDATHPDDRDRAERVFLDANARRESFRLEYRLRRADGAWRWAIDAAAPRFGPSGDFLGYIGSVIDISDRKEAEERLRESEERYRTLFETIESGFCIVEVRQAPPGGRVDYRVVEANPAFYRQTGFPHAILGRWLRQAAPDLEEHWFEAYGRVARTGEPLRFERGSDLLGRWFDVYAFRQGAPEEGRVGILFSDISARRNAEEALRELNETLETRVAQAIAEREAAEAALRQSQKMEAVGQLTGGIAHDFNNMLAAVMGSLDLLSRRLPDGDARARRYVDAAVEGTRRAALLTQRLLAFSRQQPLRPEALDVNRLVLGMTDLLRHSVGAEVRLATDLQPGLWPVFADRNQLESVMLNLAVNARDAMPEGGRLVVATRNDPSGGPGAADGEERGRDFVRIEVTDSGTGMPPEVAARAFDPFFTTKAVGKGTGLGLSQVYGFVRQSGGHVHLDSAPGQGTTVRLLLPRMAGAAAAGDGEPPPPEPPRAAKGEVVLVVEDEPAVRRFSVEALAELGYRTIEADDAAAALRLLDAHPEIALLFTDVVMPEVNGRRLAEEARRRRPDLRILFTTGYAPDAAGPQGPLAREADLLPKPFTIADLALRLRAALDAPPRDGA